MEELVELSLLLLSDILHLLLLLRQLPARHVHRTALRGHPLGYLHRKRTCCKLPVNPGIFWIFLLTRILVLL